MVDEAQYDDLLRAGDDLADGGQIEEARAVLQEGLRLAQEAGDEAFGHCFRGALAEIAGDYQRYIDETEAACRMGEASYVINTEMGVCLGNQNRVPGALEYYERALRIRPGYRTALRGHATALIANGRTEEGVKEMEALLAQKPDDWRGLSVLASALRHENRLAEAMASVERILSIRPRSALVLAEKAATLSDAGDKAQASVFIENALRLRPTHPLLIAYKGVHLLAIGDYGGALQALEASLRLWPGNFTGRYARAVALAKLERTEEAVSELRELAEERPGEEGVKRWLFRLEKPQRATELEEQYRLEEQRKRAEDREREVKLDAWRSMSGRSSHRIGNQLFAAKGALRTLEQNNNNLAISESIADLQASLDRIGRICSEFRRYNANQPPKWQNIEPAILLRDIFRRYAKTEGTRFREGVATLLPECLWDGQQIEQALGELLENAIRHARAGGTVEMTADPLDVGGRQWVRIVVTNEGDGVPLQHKARIFEPFVSFRPGGTGLGLAIVEQIVKNHGGTIRETGQPGQFARFEVDLPAAAAKERTP